MMSTHDIVMWALLAFVVWVLMPAWLMWASSDHRFDDIICSIGVEKKPFFHAFGEGVFLVLLFVAALVCSGLVMTGTHPPG
jgi:hypothetical protein